MDRQREPSAHRALLVALTLSALVSSTAYADKASRQWKWDKFIQTQCHLHMPPGWDWRIFKALVKQESQFDPNAVSWCGAAGLTQLMPKTAEELGLRPQDRFVPRLSINGGVRYLRKVWNVWKAEKDGEWQNWERTRFALGSYNAGVGTILRGQKHAGNVMNLPTDRWDSIDRALRYVQKRWEETTTYVQKIFTFYEEYKAERGLQLLKPKKGIQFKLRENWIAARADRADAVADAIKEPLPAQPEPAAAADANPEQVDVPKHEPKAAASARPSATAQATVTAAQSSAAQAAQTPPRPSTSPRSRSRSLARWAAIAALALCAVGIVRLAMVRRRAR